MLTEDPQDLIVYSREANQLCRSFSFEIESRITEESPPSELTLAVVDERKREDEGQKQLAEWRKNFEPWPVSE